MIFADFFYDYNTLTVLTLIFFAFSAGFMDSIAGGGGLIQIPALLINLPFESVPTVLGTNKIASLSGTAVVACQYSKRVKYNYLLLFIISIIAFIASNLGVLTLSYIDSSRLKPLILIILIIVAFYTFIKKDFGLSDQKQVPLKKQIFLGSIIGFTVGFYDGFFGPGTGSFLMLGFVYFLGFDLLSASAYAKAVNCITNISALIVFIAQGNFLLGIAIIMAISNILGSLTGTKLAFIKGNKFIRIIFLIIVSFMILRYSYEIFLSN
ncbi:MAG: TSUP family transporter [Ignavibacteria bacterium]|nr:TSUP family transporter [Ignavibacteria bacterium]